MPARRFGHPWIAALSAALVAVLGASGAAAASEPRFYVDAARGSDAADGRSPASAWRTLERASDAELPPGSRLLLRAGRRWSGELELEESGEPGRPIVVGPYGRGRLPRITGGCIDLEGSDLVVRRVHVHRCNWAGIEVEGSRNRIERSVVSRNVAGVHVKDSARDTAILRNEIRDNDRMSVSTPQPGDDSGAFGVLLHGDGTEVAHNRIRGSDAFSHDYGRDGAAVEVYGARNSRIHHNFAVANDAFSELGDRRSAGNVYLYNVVVSTLPTSTFLVTRGGESGHGPVLGTRVEHNTVLLTGRGSQGVVCHAGCTREVLRMRNNILQAGLKAAYADGPADEDYDLFWGGRVQLRMGPHSRVADPRFANPRRGDLRLTRESPAIASADGSAQADLGALAFARGSRLHSIVARATRARTAR